VEDSARGVDGALQEDARVSTDHAVEREHEAVRREVLPPAAEIEAPPVPSELSQPRPEGSGGSSTGTEDPGGARKHAIERRALPVVENIDVAALRVSGNEVRRERL
jgi:hypothetical protein